MFGSILAENPLIVTFLLIALIFNIIGISNAFKKSISNIICGISGIIVIVLIIFMFFKGAELLEILLVILLFLTINILSFSKGKGDDSNDI